jgi:hypothetical protein
MSKAEQAEQGDDELPEFIVAEVSTNWPKDWPVPRRDYLSGKFELIIAHNLAKGYRLHSFQVSQVAPEPGKLVETIIAVFERASQ